MRPLDGLKVLDFTRVLAGPTCTRVLAELGADVTKVEPPSGDVGRMASPQIEGQSAYYQQFNAGKKNLSIDLNWPEAQAIVFQMCARADVIVENFRPGTMQTFGLGYDAIAKENERVVYVSISGYGQSTPWSNRPAFAPTVQAEAGSTHTQLQHFGENLARPVTDWASHADVYTGLEGVIGVLAALNEVHRNGRGAHVDVSMMRTMLAVNERLHAQINALEDTGEPLALGAPESPIFEMPDGSIVTIAASPVSTGVFYKYCAMMGRNDLRLDPRFKTPALRRKNYDALEAEIQAWVSTFRTFEELEQQVSGLGGLAAGRVRTASELMGTAWALDDQPTYSVSVGNSELTLPKGPWKFNGQDSKLLSAAVDRGQNNSEVLRGFGIDEQTISDWEARGILTRA